ncbi:S-phase kinase-associated protein 2 isoform X2 [Alligator mississippiensis]|uniref:S-phase kinase-associated protein 2 isoform X2 n=1 Tax=Alligator mississippiensis TaxID=8496 RepID=UPI002877D107|nr:S-phase kinase-associated protein 2 isoform X2 [Alligator mississippiensis]
MAAVPAEPSLDALPDSLLLEILSQLPLRERLRGARVCRRWCRLVQDKVLWRHVDLTPYETLTLSGTNQVTTLGFRVASSYLKALEHLTLRQCTLKDSATHFIGCYLKQLRTLEFSNTPFLTDAGLPDLKSLKYLETLSLESCVKLSCDAIVTLGQALPRLKSLNLSGIPFDDQTVHKIQASLPNCHFSPS